MYIVELYYKEGDVAISAPRKLELQDKAWYDCDYNILYHDYGAYCYNGTTINPYEYGAMDFFNNIYFITFENLESYGYILYGFLFGLSAEKWTNERKTLIN